LPFSRILRAELVELSKEGDPYGAKGQVMGWLDRYFKEVAAAPEQQKVA
jgi:hypothetical protein